MSNPDLDAKIDELALQVERAIQEAESENEKWNDVFDPKYQTMNADAEALFG